MVIPVATLSVVRLGGVLFRAACAIDFLPEIRHGLAVDRHEAFDGPQDGGITFWSEVTLEPLERQPFTQRDRRLVGLTELCKSYFCPLLRPLKVQSGFLISSCRLQAVATVSSSSCRSGVLDESLRRNLVGHW